MLPLRWVGLTSVSIPGRASGRRSFFRARLLASVSVSFARYLEHTANYTNDGTMVSYSSQTFSANDPKSCTSMPGRASGRRNVFRVRLLVSVSVLFACYLEYMANCDVSWPCASDRMKGIVKARKPYENRDENR